MSRFDLALRKQNGWTNAPLFFKPPPGCERQIAAGTELIRVDPSRMVRSQRAELMPHDLLTNDRSLADDRHAVSYVAGRRPPDMN